VLPFYLFGFIKDDVSLKINIILTLMRQNCPLNTIVIIHINNQSTLYKVNGLA
jgi:hypothetical protein